MICTTWGCGKNKKGRPVSQISDPVPSFITIANQCSRSSTCYTKISRRTIQIQGDFQDFQDGFEIPVDFQELQTPCTVSWLRGSISDLQKPRNHTKLRFCQNWPDRRPYNLQCVGGDVKPCSINQSILIQNSGNHVS